MNNDDRTLSDDLRDFVEITAAILLAAVVFAACYASAADGGIDRPVIDVHHGRVVAADGGVFEVTGGAWLSDVVLLDRAGELVATQAELDALKARPPPPSNAFVVITNITTGIIQTVGAVMTTCLATTGSMLCQK